MCDIHDSVTRMDLVIYIVLILQHVVHTMSCITRASDNSKWERRIFLNALKVPQTSLKIVITIVTFDQRDVMSL